MQKIINALILSIVFTPVVNAESGAGESKLTEICKTAVMMSIVASTFEYGCGFREGVSGKYSAFFISRSCKFPEGMGGGLEKIQSEMNAATQEDLKVKGRKDVSSLILLE